MISWFIWSNVRSEKDKYLISSKSRSLCKKWWSKWKIWQRREWTTSSKKEEVFSKFNNCSANKHSHWILLKDTNTHSTYLRFVCYLCGVYKHAEWGGTLRCLGCLFNNRKKTLSLRNLRCVWLNPEDNVWGQCYSSSVQCQNWNK